MKQLSFKKISLLGMVLIGASAVTAAILPSKPAHSIKDAQNGGLVNSVNGGGLTCVADAGVINCHDTASGVNDASSTTHNLPDNTSADTGLGGAPDADTNTSGQDNS